MKKHTETLVFFLILLLSVALITIANIINSVPEQTKACCSPSKDTLLKRARHNGEQPPAYTITTDGKQEYIYDPCRPQYY